MKGKRLPVFSLLVAVSVFLAANSSYSQVQPAQSRIVQLVIINGQTVNAVSVLAVGGGLQTYSCLSPQQYATVDGSSQGWACYDQSSGIWLLNALPPTQAQAPQHTAPPQPQPPVQQPQIQQPQVQPQIVYPQQAPTIIYQQPPTVVYQQPPTVVYQQPATVVYQPVPVYQPAPATVIYSAPVYPTQPVIAAPVYPSSVVLGTAAINAAGRIISSAVIANARPRVERIERIEYEPRHHGHNRDWR